MQQITFFLCHHMLASGVTLPLEQLRAAEGLAKAQGPNTFSPLRIQLASLDGQPVTTHSGLRLVADCALQDITHSHLTYLPALWRNPKKPIAQNRALLPWLQRQHHQGYRLAGVGTGCCFMAEAGLLDGRAATTHWHYFEAFARDYPRVHLQRDYFITHQDRLYCTGSVNSTADLTIYFIEQLFSPAIARHVERHFFHEIRHAFEPPLPLASRAQHPDESIAQVQAWLKQDAGKALTLERMAQQAQMSTRSLSRRFKAATGLSPLQYLQQQRMVLARDLLQTSNLTLAEIADKTGYQDLPHFNALFKKFLGTTPSQYRTTVRAKLFSAD